MAKRKYRFSTREQAEQAEREQSYAANRNSVAFNAALNGNIQWLERDYGDSSAFYRFGAIVRKFSEYVIVQFHCPSTGQSTHAAVYELDWLSEEIERYSRFIPGDKLGLSYREGLYEIRRLINDAVSAAA